VGTHAGLITIRLVKDSLVVDLLLGLSQKQKNWLVDRTQHDDTPLIPPSFTSLTELRYGHHSDSEPGFIVAEICLQRVE
jgi:hypothetical protein